MKIEKYKISFLVTVLSGFISVGMAQAPFSKNYTIGMTNRPKYGKRHFLSEMDVWGLCVLEAFMKKSFN